MINISEDPIAGYYRMALLRGAPPVGIRIFYGPPKDPVTGEIMDRSHRWQAEANGTPIDLERVWPVCAKEALHPTGAQSDAAKIEYDLLARTQKWAVENDPWDPRATPRRRTDWATASPPTF